MVGIERSHNIRKSWLTKNDKICRENKEKKEKVLTKVYTYVSLVL